MVMSEELEKYWQDSSDMGKQADAVTHPTYYTGDVECIDAMLQTKGKVKVQAFCELNAFKYLWRSDEKNGIEDIRKAAWYLDKYLELED